MAKIVKDLSISSTAAAGNGMDTLRIANVEVLYLLDRPFREHFARPALDSLKVQSKWMPWADWSGKPG